MLFAILFLWQFPHFYSIAWMYKEDYARAGIHMLPVVEPDGRSTARQIVLYGHGADPGQPASRACWACRAASTWSARCCSGCGSCIPACAWRSTAPLLRARGVLVDFRALPSADLRADADG